MRSYLLLLLCLAGCINEKHEPRNVPYSVKVKVRSLTVNEKRLRDYLPSPGKVVMTPEASVFSSYTGLLEKSCIATGEEVSAGDTLAIFEAENLRLQLASANARLARIRYNFRSEALAFPRDVNDTLYTALRFITGLEEAELDVQRWKHQLSSVVVTAHISGRVLEWKPVAGAYYTKGEIIGRIFCNEKVVVESYFLQNELPLLSPGMMAEIILPDSRRVSGRLISTAGMIDSKGRIKTLWKVNATDILPGTSVTVLPAFRERDGIVIPLSAVLDIDGHTVAFTIENDTAHWKSIVTKWYNKDSAEVVQGLRKGDRLIISNLLMVNEGTAVAAENF